MPDDRDKDTDEPAGLTDDVTRTVFGGKLLKATRDRPIRPNLPWLRNLSHTKIHAALLGVSIGVFAGAVATDVIGGTLVGLGVFLIQYLFSDKKQKRNPKSTCNHRIGAHDARAKPWYFLPPLLLTTAVTYVVLTL